MRGHLNLHQRIVIVLGLGIALFVVASWTTSLGSHGDTGWVGYAPLSKSINIPPLGGLHPWVRLVIWLAFILIWIGFSMAVLATTSNGDANQRD